MMLALDCWEWLYETLFKVFKENNPSSKCGYDEFCTKQFLDESIMNPLIEKIPNNGKLAREYGRVVRNIKYNM